MQVKAMANSSNGAVGSVVEKVPRKVPVPLVLPAQVAVAVVAPVAQVTRATEVPVVPTPVVAV